MCTPLHTPTNTPLPPQKRKKTKRQEQQQQEREVKGRLLLFDIYKSLSEMHDARSL